jgi:hypothetical protein
MNLKDYANAKLITWAPGYAVTTCGKVLSLPRKIKSVNAKTNIPYTAQLKDLKEMKPTLGSHGQLKVELCINGKRKTCYVRNLVAEAFCKKPHTKKILVVVHVDENKTNCAASNLSYLTFSQLCQFTNSTNYRNEFKK